jgi:hypothetical protein
MIATNPQPPIVHLSPGPREATWSEPHCTLHPHHPQRHYDGTRRVSFRSDQEASAGWEEL